MSWSVRCGLLAVLVLAAAPTVRADEVDVALLREAPKVLKYARSKGYKNVGTLKFRCKLGTHKTSFQVGPLNVNLAERLENALILVSDVERPIGIIHDADAAALKQRVPSYTTDAGHKKLFDIRYPLAWGNEQVKADALFTGIAVVSPDNRSISVTIEALTANSGKPAEVASFKATVGRNTLNDLGQSFAVNGRSLKGKKRSIDLDMEAVDAATQADQSKAGTPAPISITYQPVTLEILYDGQVQAFGPDPDNPGENRVAEPQEGQKVNFRLTNRDAERVGVVLTINGKSALYEQEGDPASCIKWILDPGETITVRGVKINDNEVKPFKVLSAEASEAMPYTDNLGLIGMYVFRSAKGVSDTETDQKLSFTAGGGDGPPTDSVEYSGRSLSLKSRETSKTRSLKARSLAERRRHLVHASGVTLHVGGSKHRGVLDVDREAQSISEKSTKVDFPDPQQAAALVVRYYKPKR